MSSLHKDWRQNKNNTQSNEGGTGKRWWQDERWRRKEKLKQKTWRDEACCYANHNATVSMQLRLAFNFLFYTFDHTGSSKTKEVRDKIGAFLKSVKWHQACFFFLLFQVVPQGIKWGESAGEKWALLVSKYEEIYDADTETISPPVFISCSPDSNKSNPGSKSSTSQLANDHSVDKSLGFTVLVEVALGLWFISSVEFFSFS